MYVYIYVYAWYMYIHLQIYPHAYLYTFFHRCMMQEARCEASPQPEVPGAMRAGQGARARIESLAHDTRRFVEACGVLFHPAKDLK